MCGAKTCCKRIIQRVDFASTYHPFQFCNTETADVVVHIVEALTAYTLQDKMSIVAYFLTKSVTTKSAVFPLITMILHPEIDALETMKVGFVEVLLIFLFVLLDRSLRNLADDGPWQLQSQRFQCAEHEIEVQYGEENNIDGEQSEVVENSHISVEYD